MKIFKKSLYFYPEIEICKIFFIFSQNSNSGPLYKKNLFILFSQNRNSCPFYK